MGMAVFFALAVALAPATSAAASLSTHGAQLRPVHMLAVADAVSPGQTSAPVRLRAAGARLRPMRMSADDDLMSALRARMADVGSGAGPSGGGEGAGPPRLGPDELGADCMGPADVVNYILRSLMSGGADGAKAILGFAVTGPDYGALEDGLGQMQPGAFGDGASFLAYLAGHARYRTLTTLDEFKLVDATDSDYGRKVAHKLLVRRDGANWEDLFINLSLCDTAGPAGKRWLVTSIYKQGEAQ